MDREDVDELHMAAWRAFLNAHAAVIDSIERELTAERQLPLTNYDVLVALSEAPGNRLRMHDLADAVVLSRSGLTRLVDRLEADGLLARERAGDDRRGAYAVPTGAGRDALRRAWPVYARGIARHFASLLDDDEVRVITAALGRLFAAQHRPLPARRSGQARLC